MKRGMTIIELLIYAFLLSTVMGSFIQFAFSTHLQDIQLFNAIVNAQGK
jgi:hypothetical protein